MTAQVPHILVVGGGYVGMYTAYGLRKAARRGRIILVTDPKGAHETPLGSVTKLVLPEMPATVTPLVYAIAVQLIAYHAAAFLGKDVDQPRNLAKSVTVE